MVQRLASSVLFVTSTLAPLADAAPQDLRELYLPGASVDRVVTHLVTGDLTGDGLADVVASSAQRIRTWEQTAAGLVPLQVVAEQSPLFFENAPTLLFDFEDDGDLDAFTALTELAVFPSPSELYLNDGTGTLTLEFGAVPNEVDNTADLAAADLTGDGRTDVLSVARTWANELYVNTGTAFATISPLVVGLDVNATDVSLGDVDGDGDLDAVLGHADDLESKVFLNQGNGLFLGGQVFDGLGGLAILELADLDGDGDVDGLSNLGPVRNEAGTLSLASNLGTAGFAGQALLRDVDGDGDADALYLDRFGVRTPRLFANDGAAGFTEVLGSFEQGSTWPLPMALDDLDGDGDLDLLSSELDRWALFRGDGTGAFGRAVDAGTVLPGVSDVVALADVDGDGFPDALRPSPDSLRVARGTGTGRFEPFVETSTTATGVELTDLATGDLDGDGDVDAYAAYFAGLDKVWVNDAGEFADAAAPVSASASDTWSVALGDVDADGDLDALLGTDTGAAKLENDGTGSLTGASADLPAPTGRVLEVALADLDGDGDLDLAAAGTPSFLAWNDGTGTFVLGPTFFPASDGWALDVADADGDGDLDLYLTVSAVNATGLHANQGDGTFVHHPNAGTFPFARTVEFVDLESDGLPEVYLGSTTSQFTDALLRWNGAAYEVDPVALGLTPFRSHGLAHADLEGDGDLDVVLVHDSASAATSQPFVAVEPVHVLTNVRRHLAWETPPRLGTTLRMGMDAEPGAPWLLAWDFSAQATPLPPFGTLRLPFGTLKIAGSGVLDAEGRATVDVPLPTAAAFHGLVVYWQALLGAPTPGLSNLELTTLSRF